MTEPKNPRFEQAVRDSFAAFSLMPEGAGVLIDESPASADEFMLSYPNPVRHGANVTLEYTQHAKSKSAIMVADESGSVIYRRSGIYDAGRQRLELGTDDWASGTYVVTLTTEGRTMMRKIVVIGR